MGRLLHRNDRWDFLWVLRLWIYLWWADCWFLMDPFRVGSTFWVCVYSTFLFARWLVQPFVSFLGCDWLFCGRRACCWWVLCSWLEIVLVLVVVLVLRLFHGWWVRVVVCGWRGFIFLGYLLPFVLVFLRDGWAGWVLIFLVLFFPFLLVRRDGGTVGRRWLSACGWLFLNLIFWVRSRRCGCGLVFFMIFAFEYVL